MQVTLNGAQLHMPGGWVVSDVPGWDDAVAKRTEYDARPQASGSFAGDVYDDVRVLGLKGRFAGENERDRKLAMRLLAGVCVGQKLYEFQVDDEAGSRMTWVQVNSGPEWTFINEAVADYEMTFTAPDPRLLDTQVQSVTTGMAQSSGLGLEFRGPLGTKGLRFRGSDGLHGIQWRGHAGGNATSGILTLDNTLGSAEADIVLTIKGPALNPRITTATDTIAYGGSLGADDVLVINTGSGSVLLNGGNRRNLLTSAEFFTVPPRNTLDIRFSAEVQNSTAALTASYQISYAA